MAELTSNNSSATNNKGRTFSPSKSSLTSSPPVFRKTHYPSASHIPLPTCIWDVEYPRKQQLRRSVSVSSWSSRRNRAAVKPTYNLSSSNSAVRSLWSAENKEYLEMRFGLLLQPEKKEAERRNLKQQLEQEDDQHHQQHHDTSEESSIFSNPDCSSFSSGNSEDFSSAKDEPVSCSVPAKVEEQGQERQEAEQDGFLEYRLEQGNLVDNPRAVTRTLDHPAKRHNVDSSRLESPRRKLCSSNRPSFAYDDRYPVWSCSSASSNSSSNWHLVRSYRECAIAGTSLKPPDSSTPAVSSSSSSSLASTASTDHRRSIGRLLSSPVPRFHFSPGRIKSFKLSREESVSVPASREIHPQEMVPKHQPQQPEVHCKSFFLRRPGSFIRRKKREESRPMRESDGYRVAHLHCAVRNDHHSYMFVMEGTDEVLLARTPRVRGAEEESEEQSVCTFYSQRRRATRSQSWKPSWPMSTASSTSESTTSEVVASMKLSRKVSENESVDLEFVLFDATGVAASKSVGEEEARLSFSSWEMKKAPHSTSHSASSVSASSNLSGLKRNWWSLMPGSPVLRRKSSKPAASPGRGVHAQPEEDMDVLKEIWKEMEAAESLRRARAANRLQELAAIVVTAPHCTKSKTQNRYRSNSVESLPHSNSVANSNPMNLTVVLPVGQHGMPTEGIPGPSPLIKRWRFGTCDCGGWDTGCQLHVLRTSQKEPLSKLLDVSLQGPGKEQQDAFSLVGLSNGLFSVRFKDPLSPLQAFATAVAVLYRSPNAAVNRDSDQWSKALGLPNPLLHLERL